MMKEPAGAENGTMGYSASSPVPPSHRAQAFGFRVNLASAAACGVLDTTLASAARCRETARNRTAWRRR